MQEGGDKRDGQRQPVLRAAKVLFRNSAVDCLVLDSSPRGLRVSTEIFTPFPPDVLLELRSGGVWEARMRWQRGVETGFELTRFSGLNAAATADAAAIYDELRNAGLRSVTDRLAAARHFDHPDLQSAAAAVEAAVEALEAALHTAAGRGR